MTDAYGHYDAADLGLPSAASTDRRNTAGATVTYDGDTHWLECDQCQDPICPIEAGDTLDELLSKHRRHRHAI